MTLDNYLLRWGFNDLDRVQTNGEVWVEADSAEDAFEEFKTSRAWKLYSGEPQHLVVHVVDNDGNIPLLFYEKVLFRPDLDAWEQEHLGNKPHQPLYAEDIPEDMIVARYEVRHERMRRYCEPVQKNT